MITFEELFYLLETTDFVYPYDPEFQKVGREVYASEQHITFKTESGDTYEWQANEHPYFKGAWTIVFGLLSARNGELILGLTGKGDAFKILSTVLDITNRFVSENKSVKMLLFSSKEPSRTKLYKNRLKLIKGFELLHEPETLKDRTEFILKRVDF